MKYNIEQFKYLRNVLLSSLNEDENCYDEQINKHYELLAGTDMFFEWLEEI